MPSVLLGAALGGADQVAELERGVPAGLVAGFAVELGRGLDHRFADRGQVAALLVLGQAFADRRLAGQLHLARGFRQRCQVDVMPLRGRRPGSSRPGSPQPAATAPPAGRRGRWRSSTHRPHPMNASQRDRIGSGGSAASVVRLVAARRERRRCGPWRCRRGAGRRLRRRRAVGAARRFDLADRAARPGRLRPIRRAGTGPPGRGSRRGGGGCRSRGRRRRRSRPSGRGGRARSAPARPRGRGG